MRNMKRKLLWLLVMVAMVLLVGCVTPEQHAQWVRSQNWDAETTVRVLNNKIAIGMTPEQVRASWGDGPWKINRTVVRGEVIEQWIWNIPNQWTAGKPYLYFENGRLAGWQD
jgi:hypothetical protein